MNAGWWSAIAVAVIASIGTIFAGKFTGRGAERAAEVSDEDLFRQALMKDRQDQRNEIADLRKRVVAVETTNEARMAFINVLENHIWMGKQPPPPERPPGI